MKKLSIIVPAYNCENYIHDCLLSLTHQEFNENDYEIIIVNDGSSDNTEQIIKSFCANFPYMHLISTDNHGVSSARNTGMKNATGKFISFVDADDYVVDNIYLSIIALMQQNNWNAFYFEDTRTENQLSNANQLIAGNCKTCSAICAASLHTVIYSRSFIVENDISFNSKVAYGEDFLFNVFFTCACKREKANVGTTSLKLYYYRENPTSVCQNLQHEEGNKAKTKIEKSYMSHIVAGSEIKNSIYYNDITMHPFIDLALSEILTNCLWFSVMARKKPKKTWEELKNNGINPSKDIKFKNLEGHSLSLRIKSHVIYNFKHYPFFKFISFIYRIVK